MSTNVEIKAVCKDIELSEHKIRKIATGFFGLENQTDTYFNTIKGRFKLRESSKSGNYLVPYLRENESGAKISEYLKIPVDDSMLTKSIFTDLFGIRCVVKKTRKIFFYQNVRIHLDQVEQLGEFIEFEAVCSEAEKEEMQHKKLNYLMELLNIFPEDLISNSYADMIVEKD